jgi:hypothetical protein
MVDAFQMHIMQTKELGTCLVRQIGGCLFFYMRISNVYFVIVVRTQKQCKCSLCFPTCVYNKKRKESAGIHFSVSIGVYLFKS